MGPIPAPTAAAPPDPPADPGRRRLLGLTALGGVVAAAAACDAVADPDDPELLLALRATYGPTDDVLARIAEIGAAAWVVEQCAPETLDTSAIDAKVAELPALTMTPAELRDAYPQNEIALASFQLQIATGARRLESPAQLYERMVEFWSDHFNVPVSEQPLRLLKVVEDRDVIRPRALGRFDELLVASAKSPAMLLYLDNAFSRAGNINENYARELLELHTVGVDGGNTEDDVVATATLFTGWTIDRDTGEFWFRPGLHDPSPVSILGWVRPVGGNGLEHGEQFLGHLARLPATSRFVCTKLARRFVADHPDPALVADLAAVYLANDTEIVPVLTELFAHPEFAASAGAKFRRPFEYFLACARAVGAEQQLVAGRGRQRELGAAIVRLGQAPFLWPAPNGYPDVAEAWRNTGAMLARWNMAGDVAANTFATLQYDEAALGEWLDGRSAGEIVDELSRRVLRRPLTTSGVRVVLAHLEVDADDVPADGWVGDVLPRVVAILLCTDDNQYT